MRWKRLAWASCLVPVFGGCHGPDRGANGVRADRMIGHTEDAIQHQIRKDARAAWREVRTQYATRAFTAEFRDGFLDGYIDYLDRGGNAQPPVVPPPRYTQHQKYFTPEGHALIKDYFLGFKYGVDVAVATGQRQFLTVPVLLPEANGTGALPAPSAGAPIQSVPALTAVPATAAPQALPPPRGLRDDAPAGPGAVNTPPSGPAQQPAPVEPFGAKYLPAPRISDVSPPGLVGSDLPPIPVLPSPVPGEAPELPKSAPAIKLPVPPVEVPLLPPGVPPLPMDDRPLPPAEIIGPLPLPPSHPEPVPK